LNFDFVAFEPSRVTDRVNRFFVNLLQSLVIVMLILILALGLRSGSVVAAMMPLVLLATLVVMLGMNLHINLVALAAFIVVLGIMVDNHIVISERVLNLREEGISAQDAALGSTSQLYAPLVTATATTIFGFLPLYLADSSSGEYVGPLFKVVTIALICSTVFAFTITPLLSIHLFRVDPKGPGPSFRKRLQGAYEKILRTLLPRPWLVLSVFLMLFVGAFYSLRLIPSVFFPPSDRPIFILELEFPSSTSIATTEAAIVELEDYVAKNLSNSSSDTPSILNWVALAGRNAPRFILNHRARKFSPEYAYFLFNIESTDSIPFFREKLESFCHSEFPSAQVRIQPIEAGPATGFPIRIHVSGDQIDGIFQIARQIEAALATIPGVYNIGDDWGLPVKKYHVVIDEEAAGLAGVTRGEVALALQTFLTGIPATDLRAGHEVIPIIVKSTLNRDSDMEKIQSLPVYSNITEKSVPLAQIAGIEEVIQSANIIRRDFQRTVTVRADIEEGTNYREVDREMAAFIKDRNRPGGMIIIFASAAKEPNRLKQTNRFS
jgi:multidrug efflux pump subunit AcrB